MANIGADVARLGANVMLDLVPNIDPNMSQGTKSALDDLRADLNGNQQSAAAQVPADFSQAAQSTAPAQAAQATAPAAGGPSAQGGNGIMQMLMQLLQSLMTMLQQQQPQPTAQLTPQQPLAQANPAAGDVAMMLGNGSPNALVPQRPVGPAQPQPVAFAQQPVAFAQQPAAFAQQPVVFVQVPVAAAPTPAAPAAPTSPTDFSQGGWSSKSSANTVGQMWQSSNDFINQYTYSTHKAQTAAG